MWNWPASSEARPSFINCATHAHDSLRARHGACQCEWEMLREGWLPDCVEVLPEEQKHWSFRCPFDMAVADRDLCWVHQNSIHIGWNTSLERVIFVELAHDMHAVGLIRYEKGSRISTKGCLNTEQEIALWCEWVCDSVLSDLIEKAANWKVTRHTLLFRGGWITSITGFNQGYEMPQNIAPACSKPTMDCYSFGG